MPNCHFSGTTCPSGGSMNRLYAAVSARPVIRTVTKTSKDLRTQATEGQSRMRLEVACKARNSSIVSTRGLRLEYKIIAIREE